MIVSHTFFIVEHMYMIADGMILRLPRLILVSMYVYEKIRIMNMCMHPGFLKVLQYYSVIHCYSFKKCWHIMLYHLTISFIGSKTR